MGLQFNSSVDQPGTPNQASTGNTGAAGGAFPSFSLVPPGATVTTTIHRRGVVTMVALTGRAAQTLAQHFQFGATATEGWLPGDIVFIEAPSSVGGANATDIRDTAGNVLCTWVANLANGGMFVFGAGVIAANDFGCVITGPSTT